jgi:hypothetical protein
MIQDIGSLAVVQWLQLGPDILVIVEFDVGYLIW